MGTMGTAENAGTAQTGGSGVTDGTQTEAPASGTAGGLPGGETGAADAPPSGTGTAQPSGETEGAGAAMASVNVRDFGAEGDGETDDTAAVQAAIDRVHDAGGGYVYLPAGTYRLNAVCVKQDVCLYGDRTWSAEDPGSIGNTVLVPAGASVSCVVDMGSGGYKNPGLKNVCIDGLGLGTSVAGVASPGLASVTGNSMRVENVRIRNCSGVGLDATNNAIASVKGCMVTGCGTGLKLVGWDLFIYNNVIAGNKGDGISVSGGSAMSLCYNRIGWNDGCGVRFEGFARVSMTGNTFDSNASPGVYFSGSTNMALHGNLFIRNGWSPLSGLSNGGCQISVNASSGINITDNTVRGASDALTGGRSPEYGVIADVMNNCVVQGNTFENAGTRGELKTEETSNLDCVIEV